MEYLVHEADIRQLLDVGSGLPGVGNVHEVAQQVNPVARVVYVDNDPIVLAHARALLASTPEGECDYIDADLRDTGSVLRRAAETLDFGRPVAVMVLCTMQYVPDTDDPHTVIAQLMDAVPSGSFLTMSHTTRDIDTQAMTAGAARYNAKLGSAVFTARTGGRVCPFLRRAVLGRTRPGRHAAVAAGRERRRRGSHPCVRCHGTQAVTAHRRPTVAPSARRNIEYRPKSRANVPVPTPSEGR